MDKERGNDIRGTGDVENISYSVLNRKRKWNEQIEWNG